MFHQNNARGDMDLPSATSRPLLLLSEQVMSEQRSYPKIGNIHYRHIKLTESELRDHSRDTLAVRMSKIVYYLESKHLGTHLILPELIPCFNANIDGHTPLQAFAAAGEHDIVKILISPEVGGSPNDAMIGYAMAGQFDQVDTLTAAGVKTGYKLTGLALGGYVELVNNILAGNDTYALRSDAALGYAMARNTKELNKLIARRVDPYKLIQGYVAGGYERELVRIIDIGHPAIIVGRAYALIGDQQRVEEYISVHGFHQDIAICSARGGHPALVEELCTRYSVEPESILLGYMYGRHDVDINIKKLSSNSFDNAVFQLIMGGHHDLSSQYQARVTDVKVLQEGYSLIGDPLAMRYMTHYRGNVIGNYALAGEFVKVNAILFRSSPHAFKDLCAVIIGVIRGRHHRELNNYLKLGDSFDRKLKKALVKLAAKHYLSSVKFFNNVNYMLAVFSQISNVDIRERVKEGALAYLKETKKIEYKKSRLAANISFAETGMAGNFLINTSCKKMMKQEYLDSINELNTSVKIRYQQGSSINRFYQRYDIQYMEAKALAIPGGLIWLLQGRNALVFNDDVYYLVAEKLFNLTRNEINRLFTVVVKKLCDEIVESYQPSNLLGKSVSLIRNRKAWNAERVEIHREQLARRIGFFEPTQVQPVIGDVTRAAASPSTPSLRLAN